jgi:hypothetical protein
VRSGQDPSPLMGEGWGGGDLLMVCDCSAIGERECTMGETHTRDDGLPCLNQDSQDLQKHQDKAVGMECQVPLTLTA